MKEIKNLVFDIGGVLIGYRWEDMLKDYGLNTEDADRVGLIIFNDPIWHDFDRGVVEFEDLISHYVTNYPEDAQHLEYFLRKCELIRVNRPLVWEKVERLKEQGYRIYILSNYAKTLLNMHIKDMELFNRVDGKVISYQVKSIKPEPEIYKALFEKYDLDPEECLFFDDREDNVEGSLAVGMRAEKVESEEHLLKMLDEIIKKRES